MKMPADDVNLEAYKQAFEMFRHHSNLRFTVLATFLVIMGGLFTIALRSAKNAKNVPAEFILSMFAGIAIAFIFAAGEYRISVDLHFYGKKVASLAHDLHMSPNAIERPSGARCWVWINMGLVEIVYVGSIILWIVALLVLRCRARCQTLPRPVSASGANTH
jgi:uncharacterized membrane protein YesL